jgi:hypothetical protein
MEAWFLVFFHLLFGSDGWVTQSAVTAITQQRTCQLPFPVGKKFQFKRIIDGMSHVVHGATDPNSEWSDFDDLGYTPNSETEFSSSNESLPSFQQQLQERSKTDLTAIRTRQFRLGRDLILSDYVGNMGFDEVTDWQYYYPADEENDDQRQVVQPNPLDPSKYVPNR